MALTQTLMAGNAPVIQKINREAIVAQQASTTGPAADATAEPIEGETLFMEDYVPFGMGEMCGDFDGFDGDDAVAGFLVDQQ